MAEMLHRSDRKGNQSSWKEGAVMRIEPGKTVAVHYVGTVDSGRIFHSTPDDEPLVFTVGAGEVFPALEQAVLGMKVGEVRNVELAAANAYGMRSPQNVISIDRSRFPAGKTIGVGQKLSIEFAGKNSRVMMVTEVSEKSVTLDGNHPLAGQDLTFAIRVDAIR
jgi:peptidylprolyl isomerase